MTIGLFISESLLKQPFDLTPYIPADTTEIIFNGDDRIFECIDDYLESRGEDIPLYEINLRPEVYGDGVWMLENDRIIRRADRVVAIWDGTSKKTENAIDNAMLAGKPVQVWRI